MGRARPLVLPGTIALSAGVWVPAMLDEHSAIGLVITAHVIVSAGISCGLTPLMTSALGALPPEWYSHGNATVSTVQQVAGAAGTALFITMMTRGTESAESRGRVGPVRAGLVVECVSRHVRGPSAGIDERAARSSSASSSAVAS
ncbi:hypothetical protein [Nocardia sp. NPDC057227]|uniref:hypothetical protein n=1 Tax=Nocardia sp. NPDC057227 TaxID=3346056 RepID=UPI0036384F72